jgi:L-ascorbate metabolism protein UlaG (beta-lactamase superfamily)
MPDVFLRTDVQAEPLIGHWYAWLMMMHPVQRALLGARSQVRMMESYLRSPDAHLAAANDPGTRGGPYLDIPPGRADDVRSLRDAMDGDSYRKGLVSAVEACWKLTNRAGADPVEDLYRSVPGPLSGRVEFCYDLAHRLAFRLLEGLLPPGAGSALDAQRVDLALAEGDVRSFALSTPRLPRRGHLQVERPFRDEAWDLLFSARWRSRPLAEMAEALALDDEGTRHLASLTTGVPPPTREPNAGPGVRARYFGHACVLVEHGDVSILVDPVVAARAGADRFSYADLPPKIDYCLITHGHLDHYSLETLLQLRSRAGRVVVPRSGSGAIQDPSLAVPLRAFGFPDVIEVSDLDVIPVPGGRIVAGPFFGEHGDLDIRAKNTYVVDIGGVRIFFGADTANIAPDTWRGLVELTGPIDTAFVGMESQGAPLTWLYGHLFPSVVPRAVAARRRLAGCGARQAKELVTRLGARRAFVYALAHEDWVQHLAPTGYQDDDAPQLREADAFVRWCRERGMPSARLSKKCELTLGARP